MAQIAEQYGKVLYELRISHEDVESVRRRWKQFRN